jgi:hypothetical protein
MARHIETVNLGDRAIEVRELTIGEIRRMFLEAKGELSQLTLQDLLEGDFSAVAKHFLRFTSLSIEEVEDLAPSELKRITEKIREVNADFFGMLGGLEGVLGLLANQLESLTAAAPFSSSAGTPVSSTTDGSFLEASAPSKKRS